MLLGGRIFVRKEIWMLKSSTNSRNYRSVLSPGKEKVEPRTMASEPRFHTGIWARANHQVCLHRTGLPELSGWHASTSSLKHCQACCFRLSYPSLQLCWWSPVSKGSVLLAAGHITSQGRPANLEHSLTPLKCRVLKPGMEVSSCNPSTQEGEARGPQVWGQPGLIVSSRPAWAT
jgi:hypothetical protein